MKINEIYLGDCLELMPKFVDDKSVDMIFCDLPYGTTDCTWDSVIDLDKLWSEYKRVIKPKGAILLFGSEPFSSILRTSNLKAYRTEWFWNKRAASNVGLVKYHPLKIIETITVFGFEPVNYYPIMTKGKMRMKGGRAKCNTIQSGLKPKYEANDMYYPKNLIDIKKDRGLHPAQKPLKLIEYMIKTYSKKGNLILDNTCGSGTTGLGAKNLGRNFIMMEQDPEHYKTACKRVLT
jgi:site-specific DNA-methyltransferase (adenine-specific)